MNEFTRFRNKIGYLQKQRIRGFGYDHPGLAEIVGEHVLPSLPLCFLRSWNTKNSQFPKSKFKNAVPILCAEMNFWEDKSKFRKSVFFI